MTKYSHMLDIAFEVISEEDDGSDITPEQIHVAIAKRLVSLAESNEYEIGGAIGISDTYEIEEEDPTLEQLEAELEATRQKIAETKYLSFSMSALLVTEQKLEKAVHLHHEFVFNPKIQQELLAEYKKKVPMQDFRGDKE